MSEGDEYHTDLWIVRHGETEWSKSGQHTGRSDIPLTAEGERSALALKPALADVTFDLVLSSPRQRARRTAELIGFSDVVIWDDLVEWDYGDYEGRTRADIQRDRPGWSVWADGSPGGESPEQVSRRVDEVIARCREVEGVVLVFAHGHILRALAARWLDHPIELGANLELATTRISILSHDRGAPTLELWNAREPV
ncbi:MAG: histidine phosphatase family protein [Nocardioidaceae bacterium]